MYLRNSSRKMTGREKQSTANHSVQFRGVIWKTVCYDGKEGGACARGVWVGPCSVHCTWQSHAFLHCVALVSGRSYMQCRTCSLPLKVMATSWLLFLCLVISKKSCWWTLAWWQVETEEYPPPPHTHTHTHTHTHSHTVTHTHTHLQEEQEVVPGSTDVQKTSKTQTVESHVSHKGVLILNTRKQLQDTWTH